ncbi:MAG TPA: type IV toxin-antitoxin system AbiEi family antitoxin domain-containing protein [Opitutaceae bacterium]|nr:type IV toxin-antitoxin system AbiEi family antitoxin domain-containing protein [Opitutaceae bacterium]
MTKDTGPERQKLNQRLTAAPAGVVLTSAWLKSQGISSRLADYYANSGWLHRVGDGAFTVRPEPPSWLGGVFGLQQKSKSFHPGGRTALELSGLAHFLPLGDAHPVYLFSRAGNRLPAWFKGLPWFSRVRHVSTNFLPPELGLREYREGAFAVMLSAPERAALEFLRHLTLDDAGYEHANLVFEGLGTLRPDVVQSLLEACTSIKVKRVFLHLAEKHAHAWFKQLDVAKISLGSGKRVLVSGGRLDPKYLITVPAAVETPADAP